MIGLADHDTNFWKTVIGKGDTLPDAPHSYDCACLLLPAHDVDAIFDAEEMGARFVDIRVRLEQETSRMVGISRPVKTVEDRDGLAKIARTAFRGLTRFYADPRFDDERCDDYYEQWFLENWRDPRVDILMVGDGGGPAGFVTIEFEEDQASIILIAVAEHHRGHGMGLNLAKAAVNHAAEKGIPRIDVMTQGCNTKALRAFQGAGFFITDVWVWLHKWYA